MSETIVSIRSGINREAPSTPDVERAIPLMRICKLTFARTRDNWLEDDYVAVRVDVPFAEHLGITLQPDPLPPFVVTGLAMSGQWNRLMAAIDKGLRSDATPERDTVALKGWASWEVDADRTGRCFRLTDGRVFRVQERFYQGAVRIARPDHWEAVFKPIPKRQRARFGPYWSIPIMVGYRDDEMVALIQTVSLESGDSTTFPEPRAAAGGPT